MQLVIWRNEKWENCTKLSLTYSAGLFMSGLRGPVVFPFSMAVRVHQDIIVTAKCMLLLFCVSWNPPARCLSKLHAWQYISNGYNAKEQWHCSSLVPFILWSFASWWKIGTLLQSVLSQRSQFEIHSNLVLLDSCLTFCKKPKLKIVTNPTPKFKSPWPKVPHSFGISGCLIECVRLCL